MQGEAAWAARRCRTGLPRAAAATGNAATRVAGRAPPAHLAEFSAGRKNERQGKLAPVTDICS